jgi:ABC-type Fe3+ transport system permease subunit
LKYPGAWLREVESWLPGARFLDLVLVIVINLVPVVPLVILILQPFVEQVDVSLESASYMLGASSLQTFRRVLLPLVLPGLLTAGVLTVVRTVAMFELTYLVANTASAQTLITALYGDASASGITPNQAIDRSRSSTCSRRFHCWSSRCSLSNRLSSSCSSRRRASVACEARKRHATALHLSANARLYSARHATDTSSREAGLRHAVPGEWRFVYAGFRR